MKELGFSKFFAHKVFSQLEVCRSAMPDDNSENQMKGFWNTDRILPDSVYLKQRRLVPIYLFTKSCANYVYV